MIALIKRILANRDKRDRLIIQHDNELKAYGRLIQIQGVAFASLSDLVANLGDCLSTTNDTVIALWGSSEAMAELNAKLGQMTNEWTVDEIKTQLDRALKNLKTDRESQRKKLDDSTASFRASLEAVRKSAAQLSKLNPPTGDGGAE